MAPFQYTPFANPYAGNIAELMQAGPRALAEGAVAAANARARAAEIGGNASARAAEASGQAWAGAARGIGQSIQGSLGDLMRYRAEAPHRQLEALQVQGATEAARDDQLFRQALSMSKDGDLAPAVDFLKQQGGAGIAALQKLTGMVQVQKDQHDDAAGEIGYRIAKNPTVDGMKAVLVDAVRSKDLSADDAGQFLATAAQDPSKIADVARGLMAKSPKFRPLLDKIDFAKPGEVGIDPLTRQPIAGLSVAEKKPDYTINGQRFNGSGTPIGEAVPVQRPPVQKAMQRESVLLDGKPTIVQIDPDPDAAVKVFDLSGAPIENPSTRVRPIPPASVQVNNQLAAGAKEEASAGEKAIGDYRIPGPSPRSMSTPAGKAQMDRILAYNPSYDASQFPTRQKMRINFTSGAQSQTINSINTAIEHLDQFVDVAKELDNGNFQPGNAAFNWLKTTFGDSAPTNFAGIRSIMSGELASAFKKSGATDQEIKSVESAIASKNSTKQLVDYATKIAIPALGGKISSYTAQYQQVMGDKDPFKVLSPDAEAVLTKYGFDPAHPKMGNSLPQLQPNASHIVEQGGVRYKVTTDASGKVISSEVVPR